MAQAQQIERLRARFPRAFGVSPARRLGRVILGLLALGWFGAVCWWFDITPARLERGQARIRQMERRALADGRISRRERAAIDRAQDQQNQLIARLKHNDRSRTN